MHSLCRPLFLCHYHGSQLLLSFAQDAFYANPYHIKPSPLLSALSLARAFQSMSHSNTEYIFSLNCFTCAISLDKNLWLLSSNKIKPSNPESPSWLAFISLLNIIFQLSDWGIICSVTDQSYPCSFYSPMTTVFMVLLLSQCLASFQITISSPLPPWSVAQLFQLCMHISATLVF